MTREKYQQLQTILYDELGVTIPSLRRKCAYLQKLTRLKPVWYDCCIGGCMAYTGDFTTLTQCTYCQEQRFEAGTTGARQRFMYIPLIPRLMLQYRNPARARTFTQYKAELISSDNYNGGVRDFWDGDLFRKYHQRERGLFQRCTDIGFQLSLDGVQLTNGKTYSACFYGSLMMLIYH